MTNSEYIRQIMNDRELANILSRGYDYANSSDWRAAYKYWACRDGHPTGNVIKNGIAPNVWDWERTYNEESDEWKTTGRSRELSLQVWLSMQYSKKILEQGISMVQRALEYLILC